MALVRLDPTWVGGFEDVPRPEHQNRVHRRFGWPGLWPRMVVPLAQYGLLLFKDGTILQVTSWDDYDLYWSADDRIAGGAQFVCDTSSWQYAVLAAAGYQFLPVGA